MATSNASTLTLSDGRVLSYTLASTPEKGPLILLSNSLCADQTSWDLVAATLAANGFRALRYDQPGHGGSSAPANLASTTFETLADDVYALLRHVSLSDGSSTVSACGVSMGAATLVYFVAKYPGVLDKVVICDTISSSPARVGAPDVFGPRVAAARQASSMEQVLEGTRERWFGRKWIEANPGEAARMRTLMASATLDGFETCCAALRDPGFDLKPLLGKVGAGCGGALLIVGEKDADLPVKMEEMRKGIEEGFRAAGKENKVALKVIKDAGHVCYIDGFEDFTKELLSFLSS
ncbi:Alpha/beta-hydrolase [Pleurostoma richardsiae]|uniref:Alpha/beta-hydrolase n=1 Tax=Pleurostoma richardsiae TaxID=41990 RepID=A0AA38VQU0_9PEZI|nr:Alpha/beta-hydrolase [Pleurostoma richardsiae]